MASWREAQGKKVALPGDDANIFSLHVQLLYMNTIPIKKA